MKFIPMCVISGGLDWIGFHVSLKGNVLKVSSGRVGRSENPLVHNKDEVSGGWEFAGAETTLREADSRIEVVRYQNEVCLLIRTNDERETFPEELDTFFLLMWKEDNDWNTHYPQKDVQYGKNTEGEKRPSNSSTRICFV